MGCPVCGESLASLGGRVTDFLLETTPSSFQLVRCHTCTAVYIRPLPEPEELTQFYPPGYWWGPAAAPSSVTARWVQSLERYYRTFVTEDHVRFVINRLDRRHRSATRPKLLDVGCGSGAFLERMRRRGFEVRGLDTSERAARQVAQAYGIAVTVGSIDVPNQLTETPYDVVTMFHVLEHLRDPVAALNQVAHWLTPAGDLIVQVPNNDSLQARLFKTRWYGLDPPRHLVNFNLRALSTALDQAGFRMEAVRHFSLRDNAPALISSAFPRLDPLACAVRRRRVGPESSIRRLAMEFLYFILVLGAQPLAYAEALLKRGATLMVHAKKNEE